jgi:hypothetical protein
MFKLPLELLGPKTEVEAKSPLIWNGLQFQLCEELNLTTIAAVLSDCKQLNLDITNISFDYNSTFYKQTSILSDLSLWLKDADRIITDLNDTAVRFNSRLNQVEHELGKTEGLAENVDIKLYNVLDMIDFVKSGELVKGSAKYRVNYASGTYTISREIVTGPFFNYNETISITDKFDGKVIDYNPYANIRYLAGSGLYLNVYDNYQTFNVANVLCSSGSVEVTSVLNKFLIKPKTQLLYSKSVDLLVSIVPDSGFKVSVKPNAIYALDFAFSAGYGITIDNYTISISDNFYPKVVQGNGILLNKDNKNNYVVNFNFATSGLLYPIRINALYPLYSNYSSTAGDPTNFRNPFNVETYTVGVRYDYQASMQNIVDNISKSIENTKSRLTHITMNDLAEGAKRRLACPILNLFDLAAHGKLNQTTGGGLDATSQKLVAKFGTRPSNVDMSMDVLPVAKTTNTGPGSELGISFAFNVFTFLETYLQQQLNDSTFKIKPEDINTRYYVSLVDIPATSIVKKDENAGEVTNIPYNTAWIFDSSYISNTYTGMALSFTTGDIDFYRGEARNGQLNSTAINLPQLFITAATNTDFSKLKIVGKSKVDNAAANISVYTMNIYDGLYNKTYTVSWSRQITVTNMESDYMTELSGQQSPPYIRLMGRLYANWQYNDLDLNSVIYLLSLVSAQIDAGEIVDYYARTTSSVYLDAAIDTANTNYQLILSKLDKITGECKVTVDMSNVSTHDAYYSMDALLKSVSIPVKFRILPLVSASGSNSDIAAACCWNDLPYTKTPVCVKPEVTTTPPPSDLSQCAALLFNEY